MAVSSSVTGTWRWILIIEGLFTVFVGILCYFILPNNIRSCKFLTPAEKDFAEMRMQADMPVTDTATTHGVNWGEVKRGMLSISCWLSAMAYFGILAGLYSFGLFVRTLLLIHCLPQTDTPSSSPPSSKPSAATPPTKSNSGP